MQIFLTAQKVTLTTGLGPSQCFKVKIAESVSIDGRWRKKDKRKSLKQLRLQLMQEHNYSEAKSTGVH